MIPSRAIKVYHNTYANQHEEFLTTVFTPHDAHQLKSKLFKDKKIHRITFKSVSNNILKSYPNK